MLVLHAAMYFTTYQKQRILYFYYQGWKAPTIAKLLKQEGLSGSRRGIDKFLKRFLETGSIARQPGQGRPSKITTEIKEIVEAQMRLDDETTAIQLHELLISRGYNISKRTVLRCRTSLGWTFRGSAYCQLIREANKAKRLAFAQKYVEEATSATGFEDVLWTDECSVQLETHRRFCCRKRGEPPKHKPRYASNSTYTMYLHTQCLSIWLSKLALQVPK